eukprot:6780498-Prymnesium_polylepis.1
MIAQEAAVGQPQFTSCNADCSRRVLQQCRLFHHDLPPMHLECGAPVLRQVLEVAAVCIARPCRGAIRKAQLAAVHNELALEPDRRDDDGWTAIAEYEQRLCGVTRSD